MNWLERIRQAREANGFTKEDKKLARNWVTCACGEQDKIIPRGEDGEPDDDELYTLGFRFNTAVEEDNFDNAMHVLEAIEVRARQIHKEMQHDLAASH